MARDPVTRSGFSLPKTRSVIKGSESPFWDVKFYPYLVAEDDPIILAIVGSFVVHICQITEQDGTYLRFLSTLCRSKDREQFEYEVNSCAWCYLEPDDPLLAVTGESGHLQIYRPMTGELLFTLIGHGVGVVNDLATHPLYPWILASASLDGSIPHKEGLISIDWHSTGRYIVSGGLDHKICVWTVPDLDPASSFWHEISKEGRKRSSEEVRVVYYPHFITSAIHGEKVDAVKFWDDFILSKAPKENNLVLWKITGFNSALPPPPDSTAPKSQAHLETRNGFMRTAKPHIDDYMFDGDGAGPLQAPFVRILQFHNNYSSFLYMRFGILQPSKMFPKLHTIISVGNDFSKVSHWDLDHFINGFGDGESSAQDMAPPPIKQKGVARKIAKDSPATSRESSAALTPATDPREASTGATSFASDLLQTVEDGQRDRKNFPLHDFERRIAPHRGNELPKDEVNGFRIIRGVGWSVCGKWCVAVGAATKGKDDQGVIHVLERRK